MGGTSLCNGCRVVPVVMPFPSPLSTGGAGAAGTDGTLGKSPSTSSSYPTGRNGPSPGQRGTGGCPCSEHPHLRLLSPPGSSWTSRDEGRDRLSGQTRKTCSRFVCPFGHHLLHCVPPPHLRILHPLNPKPYRVPEGQGDAEVLEVTLGHQK